MMRPMFIIHAGVAEYSQILHNGGTGSGKQTGLDRFAEVWGKIVAQLRPGENGFWVVLGVILLLVLVFVWLRKPS